MRKGRSQLICIPKTIAESRSGLRMQRTLFSKLFRLSLSRLLVLTAIIGMLLGLYGRAFVFHPRYSYEMDHCEGFMVKGIWERRLGKDDKLISLIVHPNGNQFGCTPDARRSRMDILLGRAAKVYLDGEALDLKPDQLVWLYPSEGKGVVRVVDVPCEEIHDLRISDLSALERTEVWKTRIRPALIDASVAKLLKWRADHLPGRIPKSIAHPLVRERMEKELGLPPEKIWIE